MITKNSCLKRSFVVTIMPNPISDRAYVEVKCNESFTIELRDNRGYVVFQRKQVNTGGTNINLSDQPADIYNVTITNKLGESIFRKVIKN